MSHAAPVSAQAVQELGRHAETILGNRFGFVILTVPQEGGAGHIASNLDNRELLRALRNAIGAIEPATVVS